MHMSMNTLINSLSWFFISISFRSENNGAILHSDIGQGLDYFSDQSLDLMLGIKMSEAIVTSDISSHQDDTQACFDVPEPLSN
jgi:hypothetical protein